MTINNGPRGTLQWKAAFFRPAAICCMMGSFGTVLCVVTAKYMVDDSRQCISAKLAHASQVYIQVNVLNATIP